MNVAKHSILLILAFLMTECLLSGCARDFRLVPVIYNAPAQITTSRSASVQLISGDVQSSKSTGLMPITTGGGVFFFPMSLPADPSLSFDQEDQRIFTSCLCSELNRLGIVKLIEPGSLAEPDLKILISFTRTSYNPDNNQYILDVTMEIGINGRVFQRSYRIDSAGGDSFWEKTRTNAVQGKTKAAQSLMDALVRDIQSWVSPKG
jgi:hypothetical protein